MSSKKCRIYFNENQFKTIIQHAPELLKGRRGNTSKKARVKKKLLQECVIKLIEQYINENNKS